MSAFAPVLQGIGTTVNQLPGFFTEYFCQFLIHFIVGFSHLKKWRLLRFIWCSFRYTELIHIEAEVNLFQVGGKLQLEGIRFGRFFFAFCRRNAGKTRYQVVVRLCCQASRYLIHHVNELFMTGANGSKEILVGSLLAISSAIAVI